DRGHLRLHRHARRPARRGHDRDRPTGTADSRRRARGRRAHRDRPRLEARLMARFTWHSFEDLEIRAREDALAALRAERDRLLRETDWTQLPDAPLTEEDR